MQRIIDTETGTNRRTHCAGPVPRSVVPTLSVLNARLRASYQHMRVFLGAAHNAEYLATKAADFKVFTCLALLVTALFLAFNNVWDYAIDPVNYGQAIGLRLFESGLVLFLALVSWSNLSAPMVRVASFIVPLVVEATFIQVLAILDQGSSYGMGGFLYFFIFIPFLVLDQPLLFAVVVLFAITMLPPVAALFGLSAGLDWGIYNAYMWMGLVPVICILLLFEYLYWNLFCSRRQIEVQALSDALTGLSNRRHFLSAAVPSLELHRRHRRPASLLFIDIDRFKAINDAHGHCTGDAAIRHVAQMLQSPLRASDLIARYGGEEFIALLPETSGSTAMGIAERMRMAVAAEPCLFAAASVRLTVSIGVASYPSGSDEPIDIDALVRRADRALYEAKRRGRDRIVRDGDASGPEPGDEKSTLCPSQHDFLSVSESGNASRPMPAWQTSPSQKNRVFCERRMSDVSTAAAIAEPTVPWAARRTPSNNR